MAQHIVCGSSLLVELPDDIITIIGRSLSPRDILNLSLCCRSLSTLSGLDKTWLSQCEALGVVSSRDLVEWRKAVLSYKALCRFLTSVKPLVGIWVHQNPELGNVVYVMPGFASVVGCRIIPQVIGPLGVEDGPILWAPVFEVVSDDNGAPVFVLHGRDKGQDYVHTGTVKSVEQTCNVLLLEVEPKKEKNKATFVHNKSIDCCSDEEMCRKVSRSDSERSKSLRFVDPSSVTVPFSKLSFGDRRKLLEIVTNRVRVQAPSPNFASLFPCLRGDEDKYRKDIAHLCERRAMLIKMHKFGGGHIDWTDDQEPPFPPNQIDLSEIRKILGRSSGFRHSLSGDDTRTNCARKKKLGDYVRDSIRQMLRRSSSMNGGRGTMTSSSSGENKHAQLHDFLSSGDTIGLTLQASTMKLSYYREWPNMHDSRFALYKLPVQVPTTDQEYAGLWGGTIGWPPGKPTEDKPERALFFVVLSYYEESPGQKLLIATKILEGTHYVLHPNGSAMFIVNVDEPSTESFPWDSVEGSSPVDVKQAFSGEGIAHGYGFRYPGSKPGSLFVLENGVLAFLWKEPHSVLTLQRLNLEELLKKGERVPALPPIANFSYLTKSYSNVFVGFTNMANSSSSPRGNDS